MAKSQLNHILLHLARSKEFPEGSRLHGYEIVAPLDVEGHLDASAWKDHRPRCTVRRFWQGEEDERGHLVHRAGGPSGATWTFDYNPASADDDEAGFRLESHVITTGEYVSIRDDDGEMHTFKVAKVSPV